MRIRIGLLGLALLAACGARPNEKEPSDVTWCETAEILQAKCQRCHSSPTAHGAGSSLLTYADTQRVLAHGPVWAQMRVRVESGDMPPLALDVTPPVSPLTDDERLRLLGWLDHGMPNAAGGACAQ